MLPLVSGLVVLWSLAKQSLWTRHRVLACVWMADLAKVLLWSFAGNGESTGREQLRGHRTMLCTQIDTKRTQTQLSHAVTRLPPIETLAELSLGARVKAAGFGRHRPALRAGRPLALSRGRAAAGLLSGNRWDSVAHALFDVSTFYADIRALYELRWPCVPPKKEH